jgi:hypothetical protein
VIEPISEDGDNAFADIGIFEVDERVAITVDYACIDLAKVDWVFQFSMVRATATKSGSPVFRCVVGQLTSRRATRANSRSRRGADVLA